MMRVRIGKFGFANNFLPYYRLEEDGIEVIEASPRELAAMFEMGAIDFAPVPSFYFIKSRAKLRSYEFCIASRSSVMSVIVVSIREKLDYDYGCIAATSQSVTSINLLKIILKDLGLRNEVIPVNEIRASELLRYCPHALVIGDEALRARMRYHVVMDLGAEWRELSGYPMVFGISSSLRWRDMSRVNRMVMDSIRWGEEHIDVVAKEAASKYELPEEFLKVYFRTLTYRLGEDERKGLGIFEEKCHEYGLL